ncbi:MAG: hypothetical protein H0V41_12845 [Pseudonocardiales bacterium]|nr:hypothetical protein [Pseudonocardiales bacterium]
MTLNVRPHSQDSSAAFPEIVATTHISSFRELRHRPVAEQLVARLSDLWTMVTRSAYTQLRRSPVLLAGLGLLYVIPPIAAVAGLAKRCPGSLRPASARGR